MQEHKYFTLIQIWKKWKPLPHMSKSVLDRCEPALHSAEIQCGCIQKHVTPRVYLVLI